MKNTEAAPLVITIGGREWREITRGNVEHDAWAIEYSGRVGLDLTKLKNESGEDAALRIWTRMATSGVLFDLMGCFFLPSAMPDIEWTHEECQRTAEFMRAITDPDEKEKIHSCAVELIIRFFEGALVFLRHSGVAGGKPEKAEREHEPMTPATVS